MWLVVTGNWRINDGFSAPFLARINSFVGGEMSLDTQEPPQWGELNFSLPMPPASRQANATAKQKVRDAVRQVTRPLEYLLDGYVWISFDWHIHERFRWESDASADVDNIVKPLLDALSGPEGVLINDSQVRSFSSSWFASTAENQRVDIRIEFIPDEWLVKAGLVFVRLKGPLRYPVPMSSTPTPPSLNGVCFSRALCASSMLRNLKTPRG